MQPKGRSPGVDLQPRKSSTRDKGRHAEQVAAERLAAMGYEIIERNFECKLGEIDIIARQGGELVFVEVRSRRGGSEVDPIHSIDYRKQRKVARVAQFYLSTRFERHPPVRFDVVLVTLAEPPQVDVITSAFEVFTGY